MGPTDTTKPAPQRARRRLPADPAATGLPVERPPWWHYVTFNETSPAPDAELTDREKTTRYPDRDDE